MAKKPGYGSLRTNQYKDKPTKPDYTGFVLLTQDYKAGDEIKLSAWKNDYNGINLQENTYKKPDNGTYPKPVTNLDDNEVPF